MDSKVILIPVSSRGDEIERLRGTLSDKPTTQEAADYLTKHGIFAEFSFLTKMLRPPAPPFWNWLPAKVAICL